MRAIARKKSCGRPAVPVFSRVMSERWDAGCGRLLFELRARLERIGPGKTLEAVVRDEGARIDLPVWCRMTGHTLVTAEHPVYVIRRRAD